MPRRVAASSDPPGGPEHGGGRRRPTHGPPRPPGLPFGFASDSGRARAAAPDFAEEAAGENSWHPRRPRGHPLEVRIRRPRHPRRRRERSRTMAPSPRRRCSRPLRRLRRNPPRHRGCCCCRPTTDTAAVRNPRLCSRSPPRPGRHARSARPPRRTAGWARPAPPPRDGRPHLVSTAWCGRNGRQSKGLWLTARILLTRSLLLCAVCSTLSCRILHCSQRHVSQRSLCSSFGE